MKVHDVMKKAVIALPQNATLLDVVQQFLQHHLDSIPIIDAAQRVVGFITIDRLVELLLPRYYDLLRDFSALEDKGQLGSVFDRSFQGLDGHAEKLVLAADIMVSRIRWVRGDDSLLHAAAKLQNQHYKRLPVVDRDQKLVGLLSDFDVVLALLQGTVKSGASKRVSN